MPDKKREASPPDDGGHTGSTTTPEQTMIETDAGVGHAPELHRDQQKAVDRRAIGVVPAVIAVSLLLLFVILMVFMPRPS